MIRDGVREELRARGVSGASLSTVADPGCVHDGPMTTAQAARYCGFKTTAAIRKAYGEGRLVPFGKRGGKGTYVWSREALDAFLAGARGAIVPSGRPGAPPEHTGGHHGSRQQVDHEMEGRNSAEPGEARRLAQKGGRLLGSGSGRRPSDGEAARNHEDGGQRGRLWSLPVSAGGAREDPKRGRTVIGGEDPLRRIR